MDVYDLILKRRTIRKFLQKKIKKDILFDCLNAARLAPSGANRQPLEYVLVTKNPDSVFNNLKWAGYLKDGAPKKNERPSAYIVILSNEDIKKNPKYDVGLAVENIVLAALEREVASCIIASVNIKKVAENLKIPDNYNIELVVALGYPKQKSVEAEYEGDVRYYLDEEGVLHVPKRALKDIVHEERFGKELS